MLTNTKLCTLMWIIWTSGMPHGDVWLWAADDLGSFRLLLHGVILSICIKSMKLLTQDLNYLYLLKKRPLRCWKPLALGSERKKSKINADLLIECVEKGFKKINKTNLFNVTIWPRGKFLPEKVNNCFSCLRKKLEEVVQEKEGTRFIFAWK